jgi:hypothetical protein
MPLYEGTKRLCARPMTKQQYCDYRGWTVPGNEDPAEAGYLVQYQDGGKPNDDRHDGYISWSPADVFERTYRMVDQTPVGDQGGPTTSADVASKASHLLNLKAEDLDNIAHHDASWRDQLLATIHSVAASALEQRRA